MQNKRQPERSSHAAEIARRRRKEREERKRFDALREKQVRKAKHRTRRRIGRDTWKRLLIMAGVAAAVILTLVIFFRVQTIEVSGNHYYTAEEIIAASGIADGDNLLTVSRGTAAGNIIAELPYIRSVQVVRRLPGTLSLRVTEYDATYAVQDTAGDWYLITAGGKATEAIALPDGHVRVEDLIIETPVLGEQVSVYAAEGQELAAQGQMSALETLLQELEAADLLKEVASVSVPSSYNLSLWYGDRFLVSLGSTDSLAYKLEYLKIAIADQKEYDTGSIDISKGDGSTVYVTKNN